LVSKNGGLSDSCCYKIYSAIGKLKTKNAVKTERVPAGIPAVLELAPAVIGRWGNSSRKHRIVKVSGMTRQMDFDLHRKNRGNLSIFRTQQNSQSSGTV